SAAVDSPLSGASLSDLVSALQADAADPTATLSELSTAFSSASATLAGAMTSLADISTALATSAPSYELGLFTANIATGDLTDAFGLPIAADTALNTLAPGFSYEVVSTALSQITADFSGLF